jgi:hypothetical protein
LVTDLDHDLDRARLLGCADHASYIGLGYLGGAAWHLSLSLCVLPIAAVTMPPRAMMGPRHPFIFGSIDWLGH